MDTSPSERASATGPSLLDLPNELLLQICGYLEPDVKIDKDDGYGSTSAPALYPLDQQTATSPQSAATTRKKHRETTQPLINLALTCKRLTPIAQESLFKSVSLPRQLQDHESSGFYQSPMLHFLRTIFERPDLVKHVRTLAVWIWKGVPVRPLQYLDYLMKHRTDHPQDAFTANMIAVTPKLAYSFFRKDLEYRAYVRDLACPSEAMIAALLLASLPNLQAVEIYARPALKLPLDQSTDSDDDTSDEDDDEKLGYDPSSRIRWFIRRERNLAFDRGRLTQGLRKTNIESLTLSTGLHWIGANTRKLKRLTLDFSGPNSFTFFAYDEFADITELTILWKHKDHVEKSKRLRMANAKKLLRLCRETKSLHTLRLDSSAFLLF